MTFEWWSGSARPGGRFAPVVLAGLLLCAGGCGERGESESKAGRSEVGITRTARDGPVSVTLSATPEELDLSQRAEVLVEIVAEEGVTVDVDDYERVLATGDRHFEYRVIGSERRVAMPAGEGKLEWAYRYELEFFLPGEYELPGARASFVESEQDGLSTLSVERPEGRSHSPRRIETEPLTIVVRAPAGEPLSQEELTNIITLDPVELPRPWSRWWLFAPLGAASVVALAVAALRRVRRRQAAAMVRMPAHEWARQQIAALLTEDLLARGRVQPFYYRISDIVRGYVERRFNVSAPEMTTEEFLAAAAADRRFGESHTTELNRFLGACDLVKYARHEPTSGESDSVLRAAQDFVERTCERVTGDDIRGTTPPPTKERAA